MADREDPNKSVRFPSVSIVSRWPLARQEFVYQMFAVSIKLLYFIDISSTFMVNFNYFYLKWDMGI